MTDAEIAEEAARITAIELADHIAGRIDATDAALVRTPGERFLLAQRQCLSRQRDALLARAQRIGA